MPRSIWITFVVAILISLSSLPSAAQTGLSPADNAVLKAYVLDAGKVGPFVAGLSALAMAKQSDDAIAEEYEAIEGENGTSLAELRAKLTRHPKIFAFFQRHNLTADDAVLIPLVITLAGVALIAPGQMADAVSPTQVNFIRTNAALIERFFAADKALEN